jgi:hypothetical protein
VATSFTHQTVRVPPSSGVLGTDKGHAATITVPRSTSANVQHSNLKRKSRNPETKIYAANQQQAKSQYKYAVTVITMVISLAYDTSNLTGNNPFVLNSNIIYFSNIFGQ